MVNNLRERKKLMVEGGRWTVDGGEVLCVCLAWEDDVVLIWNPALAWVGVVSPKCCTPSFHLPPSRLLATQLSCHSPPWSCT